MLMNFKLASFSFHLTLVIGFIILYPSGFHKRHDGDII
jgi:hypothetical protein